MLLAQSHAFDRRLTKMALQKLGCTADEVDSAPGLMARLKTGHWDLMLVEHELLESKGMTLADILKPAMTYGKKTPVVVGLTATADGGDGPPWNAAADHLLVKPFTPAQLKLALLAALDSFRDAGHEI